ncbi:MAG: hypothetical protein JO085_10955 [Acidimicrobiia bacterium]|nr:hypothetical protein [Acidimicrobiia bacterium]
MAEEPRDFRVRLDWPEDQTGEELTPAAPGKIGHGHDAIDAVSEVGGQPPTARAAAATGSDDRAGPAVLRQLQSLSERLDTVAKTILPLPKAVKALSERVEEVSESIRSLPTATAVAELVGRVAALGEALQMISTVYGSGADRMRFAVDEVSSQVLGFEGAADDVRRLLAQVNSATAARAARETELQVQVDGLTADLRALRAAFPARRSPGEPTAAKKRAPAKKRAAAKSATRSATGASGATKQRARRTTS